VTPTGVAASLHGAQGVAHGAVASGGRAAFGEVALVDGSPAIVVAPRGRLWMVLVFETGDTAITRIDAIAEPGHLATLTITPG
jgi:RNA polymerase sigma-70 factor (ECF subfamily)